MTRRELLFQTLVKVTGQPHAHLEKVVEHYMLEYPNPSKWNQELPSDQRKELEQAFEQEASGILARYVEILRDNQDLRENRVEEAQKENQKKWGKKR